MAARGQHCALCPSSQWGLNTEALKHKTPVWNLKKFLHIAQGMPHDHRLHCSDVAMREHKAQTLDVTFNVFTLYLESPSEGQ